MRLISPRILVSKIKMTNISIQLFTTINELLQLNIIPIINTNDAVSPPQQKENENSGNLLPITDNDRYPELNLKRKSITFNNCC